MKSAIEFHDSNVGSINQENNMLIVNFLELYIHESEGEPGVDAGTVWIQPAELIIYNSQISGDYPDFPSLLDGGDLQLEDKILQNGAEIPLKFKGKARLLLEFFYGEKITIHGSEIELRLLDKPRFIENFPFPDKQL